MSVLNDNAIIALAEYVTPSVIDALGGVRRISKTLNAAQLLALKDVPQTLVDAQGADKIILPIRIIGISKPGNVAFDACTMSIKYDVGGTALVASSNIDITQATTQFELMTFSSAFAAAKTNYANKPLVLGTAASPTVGNGSLVINIYYIVIDVS